MKSTKNHRGNRKFFTIIILLILSTISTSLYNTFHLDDKYFSNTVSISSTTLENTTFVNTTKHIETIKYIFDLSTWHEVLVLGASIGNMSMCDVPPLVQPIADAFCSSVLQRACRQLPCVLVYKSGAVDQHNTYLSNGYDDRNVPIGQTTVHRIECVKSPALELYLNGPPYPSLITNGYAPVTKELYADILSQYFRSPSSTWGLSLTGESIQYYPWAGAKSLLSLFDITVGYDRDLYDIIKSEYLHRDQQYFMGNARVSLESVMLDKHQAPSYVTAPIFWMNSNCIAPTNRTGYMEELMSYISVDAWGNCGRNKGPELPPEIAKLHGVNNANHYVGKWELSKKAMMKHYKFSVAIENSIEHDYVTEKLWHPLAAGSIPLYYGAPNVDDWLPCHNCIIDLRQFANQKEAAEYIKTVSENETLYAEYHKWRKEPIRLSFQKILGYFHRVGYYSLQSAICAMAHSKSPQRIRQEILNHIGPIF